MVIYNWAVQDMGWRKHSGGYDVNKYRTLCEMENNLVVVESEGPVPYDEYVNKLKSLNVRCALYLDMGTYNYLWCAPFIDNDCMPTGDVIFEKGPNADKISNWLCFSYVN